MEGYQKVLDISKVVDTKGLEGSWFILVGKNYIFDADLFLSCVIGSSGLKACSRMAFQIAKFFPNSDINCAYFKVYQRL